MLITSTAMTIAAKIHSAIGIFIGASAVVAGCTCSGIAKALGE
jgi:hypothetical protein